MNRDTLGILVAITLSFVCLSFIILPIIHLFFDLDTQLFLSSLKDKEVWSAIKVSFIGALFSSIMGVIMGVPLGFLIARKEFPGKTIIEGISIIPIVIPHVAVGILLLDLFSRGSFLGNLFLKVGISFTDTIYGVIVAMCFVSISYIISSSIMGFRSVDPELEWTARTLGASPYYTFLKITFPLIFPYIRRGFVLAFARALSELGALLIIAYYPKSVPILLYERFENFGLRIARPITAMIIILSLMIFTIIIFTNREKKDVF